jgi:hypothetical protein
VVVVALLAWAGFEAARAFPSYIPYMNQFAWRQPHWHDLSDSNVEWGDDVKPLAGYLRTRGESRLRASVLAVWALPWYGIDPENLFGGESAEPPPLSAAIGASFLNGSSVPAGPPGARSTSSRRIAASSPRP